MARNFPHSSSSAPTSFLLDFSQRVTADAVHFDIRQMISPSLANIKDHQRNSQVFGQKSESVARIDEETRTQHQQTVRFLQLLTAKVFGSGRDVVPEEHDVGLHDAVTEGTRWRDEVTHLIVGQLNIAVWDHFRFGENGMDETWVGRLQRALELLSLHHVVAFKTNDSMSAAVQFRHPLTAGFEMECVHILSDEPMHARPAFPRGQRVMRSIGRVKPESRPTDEVTRPIALSSGL